MEINIASLQDHILTRARGRPDVHEDFDFAIERYHREFLASTGGRKMDLESTWRHVLENGPRVDDVPERAKSNAKAVAVRQEGNRYYADRVLDEAAEKYNESICWAEPGSEELGIGFANRSAICYEHGDYEICLLNIALARKHNCPVKLEPKLAAREQNCRQQIAAGMSQVSVPNPRFAMNVESDPKIPFMAKGLRMTEVPAYGRAMVAERSFRPGDVLMKEKVFMTMSDPQYQYLHCHFCGESKLFNLIPCTDCASVMYCSDKCRQEDKRTLHRFECGIKEKLNHLYTSIVALGPRMFLYGLTLFGDNVDEMQKVCEAQKRSGSNPMDVDYSNGYNPLEVFKNLNQVKVTKKEEKNYRRFMFTASIYFTVYMQSPAVRALIVSEDQQKFMLRCFMDYKQICLQASMFFWDEANAPLFPIASIINHSCDPNVYAIPRMSHFKMVALKPIAKGEQIFFSYGPVWYKNGDKAKQDSTMSLFLFQCDCVACNPARLKRWLATQKRLDEHGIRDLRTCSKVIADDLAPLAAKMNAVQQFIKKYAHTHPNESFCSVLQGFTDILYEALMNEWANKMRSEALEQVDRGL
ncbi:hypothetical protein quinque_006903 [Culex quinquefasciatus]|uniref:SET and MYND domain-containing protein 4 n=1 Tax=Culex quinquefasciatus TaxID=7176 RepID=UPI0018E349AC|nr:SET and MYND domain-containing protein 4 [Culex quinquefasciatus]XP_038110973.1 SET and MYND domain-containing protein 4 [Culex quinquefasciatus]